MKYKLLQIKDVENCPYTFGGYNSALKNNFSLKDYGVVYEGEVEDYNIEYTLENLFERFNISVLQPKDFTGRSMSVSDIVELDGKYYYCDHIGFKKITDLCS